MGEKMEEQIQTKGHDKEPIQTEEHDRTFLKSQVDQFNLDFQAFNLAVDHVRRTGGVLRDYATSLATRQGKEGDWFPVSVDEIVTKDEALQRGVPQFIFQ